MSGGGEGDGGVPGSWGGMGVRIGFGETSVDSFLDLPSCLCSPLSAHALPSSPFPIDDNAALSTPQTIPPAPQQPD